MPTLSPSSFSTGRMQASQQQPAGSIRVPLDAIRVLAITTAQQSDDVVLLIEIVGRAATRLEEPRLLDWLSPFILQISARLDTMQEVLRAVLEENVHGE